MRVAPFILLYNYFRLNIHNENGFKQIITNLSYNIIYAYSRIQIAFGKTLANTSELINSQPLLKNISNNALNVYKNLYKKLDKVEYIKDNKVESYYPINYNYSHPGSYDFIIATYHNDNYTVYKKIFYSPDEITSEYIVSDIQFMLVEFYIGEQCFVVNLNDSSNNYNVVGNKINFLFLLYYVYVNYPHRITKKLTHDLTENYRIRILDHNVNIVEIIRPEDYVLLQKDGYETHINVNEK